MASQIAVRLPDSLLADLDWLVLRIDALSRADAVRIALENLVNEERRREIDERYVAAYTRDPQTDADVERAQRTLDRLVAAEPWDEDDR